MQVIGNNNETVGWYYRELIIFCLCSLNNWFSEIDIMRLIPHIQSSNKPWSQLLSRLRPPPRSAAERREFVPAETTTVSRLADSASLPLGSCRVGTKMMGDYANFINTGHRNFIRVLIPHQILRKIRIYGFLWHPMSSSMQLWNAYTTWVPDIEITGLQDNRARCADKTSHSRWSAGGMKKNPGGPTTGTPEYRWRFFSREVPAMMIFVKW